MKLYHKHMPCREVAVRCVFSLKLTQTNSSFLRYTRMSSFPSVTQECQSFFWVRYCSKA